MKLPALAAAGLAAAGLAAAQDLTPIPAPLPAPSFDPAPAYAPPPAPGYGPTYEPAPLYGPAPHQSHYAPAPGPAIAPYSYEGVLPAPAPLAVPVRYKDLKNIAPCAVPQTVCVNGECGVQYVNICAPPTCVDVKRKRNKTVFDYGDYEVEIHTKKRGLVVDYDD